MTTIHNLPEEILSMIFNKLGKSCQKNCQHVCRSWYFTAHTALLNTVELEDLAAIKIFNESIDCNPDPAYLTAVKSIGLGLGISDDFHLDDEVNQKLFYRFPNLRKVILEEPGVLENFNDDMCKTFLKNCPKLEKFFVDKDYYEEPDYRDFIYKAKLLITEVDLGTFEEVSMYGDIVQYLGSFPRLQAITGEENSLLTNFEQLLRILERAPNLTSICMGPGTDNTNAAEKYLTSKPQDEQDMLINRLSKIECFSLYNELDFCANSLKFVLKYLHGLKDLAFCSMGYETWTDTHTELICSLLSDLHRFQKLDIQLYGMDTEVLAKCFPIAVREASTSKHIKHKSLELRTLDINQLHLSSYKPSVCINIDDQFTLSEIGQLFFKSKYDNVDYFTLSINERNGIKDYPTSLEDYNLILGQMPSLKQARIEITTEFVDEKVDQDGCKIDLPLVENFTIYAKVDAEFQSLLDSYYFGFPNLKHLKLSNFSGNYNGDDGEFRVELPRYCLESLQLDITPVKSKSMNVLKKETDGYLIMEVRVVNTSERHLYKISLDLSSVSKLNDSELKGATQGKDYFLVRVIIGSLQNLQVEGKKDYYRSVARQISDGRILNNGQWKS